MTLFSKNKNNIEKLVRKLKEQNIKVQERDRLLSQLDLYRKQKFIEINTSLFASREKDYLEIIRNGEGKRNWVIVSNWLRDNLRNTNEFVDLTKLSVSDYCIKPYFCWKDFSYSSNIRFNNRMDFIFYKGVEIVKHNIKTSDMKVHDWPNRMKFSTEFKPRFCIGFDDLFSNSDRVSFSTEVPGDGGNLELIIT